MRRRAHEAAFNAVRRRRDTFVQWRLLHPGRMLIQVGAPRSRMGRPRAKENTMTQRASEHTRRALLARSAAVGLGLAVVAEPNTAEAIASGGSNQVRPFRISVPQSSVDEMRRRILATQWPERETVSDQTQGVP